MHLRHRTLPNTPVATLRGIVDTSLDSSCEALMALNIKSEEKDRLARHLADEIRRMQRRLAALPRLDHRTDEEILGYDDVGLPS